MIECSICKANNEDRSLFCLECGQRLIPKVPDAQTTSNILPATNLQQINVGSSGRLHSPILDLGGHAANKRNKPLNKTLGFDEDNPLNGGYSNNISRNGLHSPLLDGQNHFVNPYPNRIEDDAESANGQSKSASQNHLPQNPLDKSRLHSPVLDGPLSASFSAAYMEETYTQEEEYESLRSPLLQAKVPLPDKSDAADKSTGQDSRLQSLLGAATGPSTKAAPDNPSNIAQKNSMAQNSVGQEPGFVAPLSITGINKLSQANQANLPRIKSGRISGSNSLLPSENELSPRSQMQNTQGNSSLNKTFLISLIFLAFGFKVWYLSSLGSAVFGSIPFAFDQFGQIIIFLLMLVLVLS